MVGRAEEIELRCAGGDKKREALKVKAKAVSPRIAQSLIGEVLVKFPSLRGLSRVSCFQGHVAQLPVGCCRPGRKPRL